MSKPVGSQKINYDDPDLRITPYQQALASCTGAVITSLFVTPLDVIKIRLQAQQKDSGKRKCFLYCNGLMDHICSCGPEEGNRWYQRPGHFNGTFDAFVKIGRTEGITSLWSGLSPTLVLSIPMTILYFVSYEQLRLYLKDSHNRRSTPKESLQQPYWIPVLAGATARTFSATVVSPLELIRTKMQSRRMGYLEIGKALQLLVKQDGIGSLWKGIFPTLLRDVPFSAIYWMHYEAIKSVFSEPDSAPSFWLSFFGGAIAGSIAAMATVPFDVVKTHQQIEFGEATYSDKPVKSNMNQIMRQIYRGHGIKGLFAGSVPRLIKVAPACAIMISSFEYGKVFFNRLANEQFGQQHLTKGETLTAPTHTVMANQPTSISNINQFTDKNIISSSHHDVL